MIRNALTLALLLAAGAASAQSAKDAWKAARPSGKPESCLLTREIRETRVRDDRTIDFYTRSGKVYRNTLPAACPQLGSERRFSYAVSTAQLCSVDIITVLFVNSPIAGPSCGLGKFQPITIASR